MPAFLKVSVLDEKRCFHDSILEDCDERFRPMSFRKVSTSGTKGVGSGIWFWYFFLLEACLR